MKKRNKQPDIVENVVVTIGRGLWFLISWPFRKLLKLEVRSKKIDKIANLRRWAEIEKILESGDEIHARQVVIEADKFFENVLKLAGAQGDKFADKLRNYEDHFSRETYQAIWEAHKLRNQITHDSSHKPTISDCKIAVERFKRGLNSLGAI